MHISSLSNKGDLKSRPNKQYELRPNQWRHTPNYPQHSKFFRINFRIIVTCFLFPSNISDSIIWYKANIFNYQHPKQPSIDNKLSKALIHNLLYLRWKMTPDSHYHVTPDFQRIKKTWNGNNWRPRELLNFLSGKINPS